MSNSLKISPLPSARDQDQSEALLMEREGFVDENAISAMVSQPFHTRTVPCPEDLVLSLDDMDFAGWHTAKPAPFQRAPEVPPQVINAIVRHSMPSISRFETETLPAPSGTRWWLAALTGALTSLTAAVVFVGVSPGPRKTLENFFTNAATVLTGAETLGSTPQAEEVFEP